MRCPRCSGLLIEEGEDRVLDMERCLNCGYRHFTRPYQEEKYVMDAVAFAAARRAT